MSEHSKKTGEFPNQRILHAVQEIFQINDVSGLEISSLIHQAAHYSSALNCQQFPDEDLSRPRWALLLYLYMGEKTGNADGLTPTLLSTTRRVSRNTISSLIRGLENQGLVQRELDPKDLRHFLIRLTPAGRELIERTASDRIAQMNQLTKGLTSEETQDLRSLLIKLIASMGPLVVPPVPCSDKEEQYTG